MSFDLKVNNGNLVINKNGDLETVSDTNKLIQDSLKIILTPLGSNPLNPWYGSNLSLALLGNTFDMDFGLEAARIQITTAMENLKKMQLSQSATQILSPAETIAAIKDVYVNTNPIDQRLVETKVSLLSGAITVTEVKFTMHL